MNNSIFEFMQRAKMSRVVYKGAVAQTCSVKKVFLEISQNSQENTCARVSFLIGLFDVFKGYRNGTLG